MSEICDAAVPQLTDALAMFADHSLTSQVVCHQILQLDQLAFCREILSCSDRAIIMSSSTQPKVINEAVDQYSRATIVPHDVAVKAHLLLGRSICLQALERSYTSLLRAVTALRNTTAQYYSESTVVQCNAYLSLAGNGVAPHVDNHDTVILQLRGKKAWSVWNNDDFEHPTGSYMIGDSLVNQQELTSKFGVFAPERRAPDHSILMVPGAVLYIPRGTWHSTKAEDDSLSLTFGLHAACWIDAVTSVLRDMLASYAPLRDSYRRSCQNKQIITQQLLERCALAVSALSAQQLLALVEDKLNKIP